MMKDFSFLVKKMQIMTSLGRDRVKVSISIFPGMEVITETRNIR